MATEVIDRTQFIGGSDIAAILGLSRWKTPLSVWAEKTGHIPPKEVTGEAVELGTYLEEYIARRFARETGKTVMRKTDRVSHPRYPIFRAQIDRLVVNEDAVLECKSTGERMAKAWADDEIPPDYICQVMWQLACTGRKTAYIAVLIGNREFKYKQIDRDPIMIAEMLKRAQDFWDHFIVPRVMPMQVSAQDNETLLALFPEAELGTEVELGDEGAKLCELRASLWQDRLALDNQIERIEAELKAKVKTSEVGLAGNYRVFWKNAKRKAYTVEATQYRRFVVNPIKENINGQSGIN